MPRKLFCGFSGSPEEDDIYSPVGGGGGPNYHDIAPIIKSGNIFSLDF